MENDSLYRTYRKLIFFHLFIFQNTITEFSIFFFKWDEKITTLPGLYYLSTTIIRIVALALKEKNVMNICTVNNLRLSNLFLSTLNFIVIYKILVLFKTKKHANSNESISVSKNYK